MIFVNEIATIVHEIVDYFQGASNKNVGDAFLLVWKFEASKGANEESTNRLTIAARSYLSDCALTAFLKIIALLNTSPSI